MIESARSPSPLLDGLDDRLAIVGTSGAGKTYAARGLVELLVRAGARSCVVDPLGVWWGLRAGRDGTATGGLPVLILGGAHADVAITEEHGAAIGRLVGSSHIQCVLDVSTLPSKAARQRFMRAFLEVLYETNTQPLHLVLDEADLWAPQRPMPDQAVLQNRVGEIVRRGRVRGFIPWLITQRPAVLDKDVLSQADTLIAMKLTSSQDRAAIGAWIEGQADRAAEKRVLADLPRLPRGEGYVWAPARDVLQRWTFPAITTFDSSRTPARGDPAIGAALAPVDAAAALAALTKLIPAGAPVVAPSADALAAARAEGVREGLRQGAAALAAAQGRVDGLRAAIKAAAGHLMGALGQPADGNPRVLDLPPPAQPRTIEGPAAPARRTAAAVRPTAASGADLHPAARAVLAVLASRAPGNLRWRQVATLAGLAPQGGHWNAGRKQLRDAALIAEEGDGVRATPAGIARAGSLPPFPTEPAALRDLWCAKLASPAPEMLRALAAYPAAGRVPCPVSAATLARDLGKQPRGGHWNAGLKVLRDNGLVTQSAAGLLIEPELCD